MSSSTLYSLISLKYLPFLRLSLPAQPRSTAVVDPSGTGNTHIRCSPCNVLSVSLFLSVSATEDVDRLDEERSRRARNLVGSEEIMAVERLTTVRKGRPGTFVVVSNAGADLSAEDPCGRTPLGVDTSERPLLHNRLRRMSIVTKYLFDSFHRESE